jgi:hypothetical protein
VLLFVAVLHSPAYAGEIPGLRSSLPTFIESDFELTFSNDFLGRGGSVDDFRTQQIIIAADLGDNWTALLDHSVLTLTDSQDPGRIDQLSGSVGYRLLNESGGSAVNRITAGLGFRSVGDFAGERMQNGFHRLISSNVEDLPYSNLSETYLTAWIDAERYRLLHQTDGGWRFGYWLRANSLVTSDGQWDGSLLVTGMASKSSFDFWTGLRQDWRSGYKEPVQRATAAAEDDLAVVIGVRFGSLVLETVQQLNNDASFGQLRLLSSESDAARGTGSDPGLGFELGFLLPDVHLHLAARLSSHFIAGSNSPWNESVVFSADLGEPQYKDDASIYVDSMQFGIGLEWERRVSDRSDWLSGYGSVALGWRREQLIGDRALVGQKSGSADSGVLILGTGLRFHASALGERWRYRIQTGISAWLPFNEARLTLNTMDLPVLQAAIGLSLGVTFDFD